MLAFVTGGAAFLLSRKRVAMGLLLPSSTSAYRVATDSPLPTHSVMGSPKQRHCTYAAHSTSSVVVWRFKNGQASQSPRRRVLIVCGGNCMTLDNAWREWCDVAAANGVDLVMWDYPGSGRSGGVADTRTMLDAARAVKRYVVAHGYEPQQIIVWGHSIGGGAAAAMSANDNTQCGLILTSTFGRLSRVVAAHTRKPLLMTICGVSDLAPEAHLTKTTCPIVLVHSRKDTVVPFTEMQRNARAARSLNVKIHEVDGGHNDADAFTLVAQMLGSWF